MGVLRFWIKESASWYVQRMPEPTDMRKGHTEGGASPGVNQAHAVHLEFVQL